MLAGAKIPQVSVIPKYAHTFGPEANDLAIFAGLYLDEWQKEGLNHILAYDASGKWCCFEYAEIVSRQNGKGAILEARVLAGFFLLGERLIMWSAHEYKTATEAFLRMRDHIRTLERERVIVEGSIRVTQSATMMGFEHRDTGQRVRFLARSKSSGRGFSGDLNIIDETFAYTAQQHAALMPTMSARQNPQVIYTSTPPLDGDTGEVLFDLRKRALQGNDPSLGYRDWGIAGKLERVSQLNLDDRTLWAQSNPALGIRITEETIARERRSMGLVEFGRERLGLWPTRRTGGGVIDPEHWQRLIDRRTVRTGDCALGVDIAPDRSCAAIALYGCGLDLGDGDSLGHAQLASYLQGTGWIIPRLKILCEKLNPVAIGLAKGTYASLEAHLRAHGIAVPVDPEHPQRNDLYVLNWTDMAAACGQLIDAVNEQTFRLRPDEQGVMNTAVAGAHIRQGSDSIAWARKSNVDISPLVAVTVARFAFNARVKMIDQPVVTDTFFGSWR